MCEVGIPHMMGNRILIEVRCSIYQVVATPRRPGPLNWSLVGTYGGAWWTHQQCRSIIRLRWRSCSMDVRTWWRMHDLISMTRWSPSYNSATVGGRLGNSSINRLRWKLMVVCTRCRIHVIVSMIRWSRSYTSATVGGRPGKSSRLSTQTYIMQR